MFEFLLKVKEEYLADKSKKDSSFDYERFSKEFTKFQEESKSYTEKHNKDQLYGRPFKV